MSWYDWKSILFIRHSHVTSTNNMPKLFMLFQPADVLKNKSLEHAAIVNLPFVQRKHVSILGSKFHTTSRSNKMSDNSQAKRKQTNKQSNNHSVNISHVRAVLCGNKELLFLNMIVWNHSNGNKLCRNEIVAPWLLFLSLRWLLLLLLLLLLLW